MDFLLLYLDVLVGLFEVGEEGCVSSEHSVHFGGCGHKLGMLLKKHRFQRPLEQHKLQLIELSNRILHLVYQRMSQRRRTHHRLRQKGEVEIADGDEFVDRHAGQLFEDVDVGGGRDLH